MPAEKRALERASKLVRRLKGIREPRMRWVAISRELASMPPEEAVAVLGELVARAHGHPPGVTIALDSLAVALADPELIPYELRRDLYGAARLGGRDEIARLFFQVTRGASGEEELEEELEGTRQVVPRGRTLTLGERKAAARSHRRDLLLHLLRDPHPQVVEILLGNPHVTEQDVLVIASRRPQAPRALEMVFKSERWGARYRVKRALVLNPHTPLPISARLMTTLRQADLRAAAADGNLDPSLRRHASEILTAREAAMTESGAGER